MIQIASTTRGAELIAPFANVLSTFITATCRVCRTHKKTRHEGGFILTGVSRFTSLLLYVQSMTAPVNSDLLGGVAPTTHEHESDSSNAEQRERSRFRHARRHVRERMVV
jgi:hypothetical protein